MTTEPLTRNDNLNNEIIQWGRKYLSSYGYTLKNNLHENVQNSEWPLLKKKFENWLKPDNFDPNGNQIKKISEF